MRTRLLFFITLFISNVISAQQAEKISFLSLDSLEITADLYEVDEKRPHMLLCHQAGFSRAEYSETAPELMKFGYNCMAIDQRSGNAVMKIENETAKRAIEEGKRRMYMDAYQDMEAALLYLYERGKGKKVVLVGSSYSAALVLKLANEHSEKVEKVLAFSPGEYIKGEVVEDWFCSITVPLFVTSSKVEIKQIDLLKENCASHKLITHFEPADAGIHGTRALWKSTPNNSEYWVAVRKFMGSK